MYLDLLRGRLHGKAKKHIPESKSCLSDTYGTLNPAPGGHSPAHWYAHKLFRIK